MNTGEVGLAIGSRLQAETAVSIFTGRGMPLDRVRSTGESPASSLSMPRASGLKKVARTLTPA